MSTRLAPYAYALLRIVSGAMFAFHGVQKLFGVLSDQPQPAVGSQMWIGGVLELVCGLAIAIGLFTWLAAFLASGEMAVAYFQFHFEVEPATAWIPHVNKGELAVLYCFVFFYMAFRGNGPWSVGANRKKPQT